MLHTRMLAFFFSGKTKDIQGLHSLGFRCAGNRCSLDDNWLDLVVFSGMLGMFGCSIPCISLFVSYDFVLVLQGYVLYVTCHVCMYIHFVLNGVEEKTPDDPLGTSCSEMPSALVRRSINPSFDISTNYPLVI